MAIVLEDYVGTCTSTTTCFVDKWVRRPSEPHPMLLVTTKLLPVDHAMFIMFIAHVVAPMQNTTNLRCVNLSMVPTTLSAAHALGVKTNNLVPMIPVKLQMREPIQKDLGVMGASVFEIAVKDASGSMESTHEPCYIMYRYMSPTRWRKSSCAGIPPNFPTAASFTLGRSRPEGDMCSCPWWGTSEPTTQSKGLSACYTGWCGCSQRVVPQLFTCTTAQLSSTCSMCASTSHCLLSL